MDGLPTCRRVAAVIALSLGTMMSTMNGGSINIALPTVAHELNVQPSEAAGQTGPTHPASLNFA